MLALEQRFLREMHRLLGADYAKARLLLAVSGGRDSMALAVLAWSTLPRPKIALAHYNHKTRTQSDQDELFVSLFAQAAGLSFVGGAYSGQWAKAPAEATLRRLRRSFLKRTRQVIEADFILTAHHANDQLETILMRMMRGAGVRGLRGIPEKRGPWVRPLLRFTRLELDAYLREKGIGFCEDQSNQSRDYLRNRVRQDLVPVFLQLARPFGDEARVLSRLQSNGEELAAMERALSRRWRRRLRQEWKETPYWFRLPDRLFRRAPSSLERQILIRAIVDKLGGVRLTRASVERLDSSFRTRMKSFPLTEGYEAQFSCGHWFFPRTGRRPERVEKMFQIELQDPEQHEIRWMRAGDRIGSSKLKKRVLALRIPRPERRFLPVVVRRQDGEVVWFYPSVPPKGVIRSVDCEFPFTFRDTVSPQPPMSPSA